MEREIFKNAPLVEMIVEVRWRLTPVSTVPNGGVDPFYDVLKLGLASKLKERGYGVVQEIVPQEVPREFLAGQATTQFRKGLNQWPLFQLGPGVFTANITEDYTGWKSSFRDIVITGIEALYESHPAPKMLDVEKVRLIAIDAFSAEHEFRNYVDFSRNFLGLGSLLPDAFIEKFWAQDGSFSVRSETAFELKGLSKSVARIGINEGAKNGNKALMLESTIETACSLNSSERVVRWLDDAHLIHRDMFRGLLTEELKSVLQPEMVT